MLSPGSVTETSAPVSDHARIGVDGKGGPAARRAKRYDFEREVTIFYARTRTVAGLTINMSQTGLAVRISHSGVAVRVAPAQPDTEPVNLQPGDEVVVQGIVDVPVESWVIDYSGDVVRLHFMATPTANEHIKRLIDALEAKERRTAEVPAAVAEQRKTGRGVIAALLAGPAVLALAVYGVIASGLLQTNGAQDRLADRVADPRAFRSLQAHKGNGAPFRAVVLGEGAEQQLPSGEVRGATIYRVAAGTHFPVRIVSTALPDGSPGIEADLDGDLRDDAGQVLLPKGTRLIGNQEKAGWRPDEVQGIFWTKVVLPNGKALKFTFIGTGADRAAANLSDAPIVTTGQIGAVGGRLTVQLNRDLALPAYSGNDVAQAR